MLNHLGITARVNSNDDMTIDISVKYILLAKESLKILNGLRKSDQTSNVIEKLMEKVEMLREDVKALKNSTTAVTFHEKLVLSTINSSIAMMYENCVDTVKLSLRADYLTTSLEFLSGIELNPEAILLTLIILNELGKVWFKLNCPRRSYIYLDQALEMYMNYTKEGDDYPEPIDILHLYCCRKKEKAVSSQWDMLDKLQLLTINNLIKVFDPRAGMHRFMRYIHNVLANEIVHREAFSSSDYTNWIFASFYVGEYLTYCERFPEARHHIAAAFYMLETLQTIKELSVEHYYYIHFCGMIIWGNYGRTLFCSSVENFRKLRDMEKKNEERKEIDESSKIVTESEEQCSAYLMFACLNSDLEPFIEQITDKHVSTYIEALVLFTTLKKWFESILTYWEKKNNLLSQAINIMHISKIYKYMAFFEGNRNNVLRMHTTRKDLLKGMRDKLENSSDLQEKHMFKLLCQELTVIICSCIDMHQEVLDIENRIPCKKELEEIEGMVTESIDNCTIFLHLMYNSEFDESEQ